MNIYNFSPLAASLVNLFLGGLVIGKRPRNQLNQVWAFLSLCLAVWSFGTFMLYLSPSEEVALSWLKFYNVGLALIPATFINFSLVFAGASKKKINTVCGIAYCISGFFILLSFTPLFNSSVQHYSWGYYPRPGSLNFLYDVFFLSAPFAVARILVTDYRKSGPRKRNQYRYIFVAMAIAFGSSVTNFLPIYGGKNYPLGHFGILLTGLIISFAIIKYQLMDISIIIRKSAVYSLLTAIVTAAYVAIVFIVQQSFQGFTGYRSTLPVIIVASIVAISFEPVRHYVQVIVDKIFFRKKYEYQQVTQEATDKIRQEVSPIGISRVLINSLVGSLNLTRGCVMVYERQSHVYVLAGSNGMPAELAVTFTLSRDDKLVEILQNHDKIILLDDPDEAILRRKVDKDIRKRFEDLGISTICPMRGKSNMVGILLLGEKKSGDLYKLDDAELVNMLATQAAISIENSRLYDELQASYLSTIKSLVSALEAKDVYTKGHSERVADYARNIASQLGMSDNECQLLYEVSLLHDVGKIGVSEHILNKKSSLSPHEFSQIQAHTIIGERILSTVESVKDGLSAVRHHHEKLNGDGYPDGLSEMTIPLPARILAVADAYDAMTTKRPYRKAMTPREALEELKRHAGQQFDPKVVRAFIATIISEKSRHSKAFRLLRNNSRVPLKSA